MGAADWLWQTLKGTLEKGNQDDHQCKQNYF